MRSFRIRFDQWAIRWRKSAPAGGLLVVFSLAVLAGCSSRKASPVSKTKFTFDTVSTISLYDPAPPGTFERAFALLNRIGNRMTIDTKQGELIDVNKAAGEHPVKVDPELYHVIRIGLRFSRLTDGVFDIAIGPLTKLWGIGTGGDVVPPDAKIKRALALIDYRDVVLNDSAHTVYLKRREMVIDLGAIAKGYAGDKVKELLVKAGMKHAIIDLGGNVVTIGGKPDGSPWRIGIQAPDLVRGKYMGILSVRNEAVVSSGQYERFFTYKGRRYGHILSTRTGFPVANGIAGTTIIASSSTDADALSTSVFALGIKKGLALVDSLPHVEAIILTDDKRVYVSRGVEGSFRITDSAYHMASLNLVPSS